MPNSCKSKNLPVDFRIKIDAFGKGYRLETFLPLPIPREKVFEGAEYDYYIRWFGLKLKWRSRIQTYNPPYDFTDIQIVGPYSKWEHTHIFKEQGASTLMFDTVVYKIPFSYLGRAVHGLFVQNQLQDIFCYRALKIMEWVKGLKDENFI